MTLGADVAAALPGLRAQAESLMTDTWRCVRGGTREFNDETGEFVETPPEVVYDGPGRLRDRSSIGSREAVQGVTTVVSQLILSLPVATSGALRVDDRLECIASAADASMVGVRVKVTDLHLQTHSTARRFTVEVTSWPTSTT